MGKRKRPRRQLAPGKATLQHSRRNGMGPFKYHPPKKKPPEDKPENGG